MIASTYRLQLHSGFGFTQACAIVDYLDQLGITHAYASPYLTAQKGSQHGYDLVDPKHLNPELGNEDDYRAWTDALRSRGMGHLVDFVPNHMAASPTNGWWRDVLENGQNSIYADYFDIEWRSPKEGLRGKVLLPILGAQYGQVLEKGELVLKREGGAFTIHYWERALPVDPATVGPLLERTASKLDRPPSDPRRQDLESIALGLIRLVHESPENRAREKEVLKRRLAVLARDPSIADAIDAVVAEMNGTPGDPRSFDHLDALLLEQNYRLAFWRVASDEINYRRFFEVNDLAAIRMEDPKVFDDMHEKLLALVAEGRIDGVRLDHVDGLYDPAGYFALLRGRVGPLWIGAEKILSGSETLPDDWPIDGTTGYEWLAAVNGLLVDPRGEETFTRIYREMTGESRTFAEQVREAKRTVLRSSLASELGMLALRLERLATRDRRSRDFTLAMLRRAVGETITAFPVYRTYVRPDGAHTPNDEQIVTRAIRLARRRNPEISRSVFAFLEDQLLLRDPATPLDPESIRGAESTADPSTRGGGAPVPHQAGGPEWGRASGADGARVFEGPARGGAPVPHQAGGPEWGRASGADGARVFEGPARGGGIGGEAPNVEKEAPDVERVELAMRFQQLTGPVTAKGVEDTAFYTYVRFAALNEVGGSPEHFGVSIAQFHARNAENLALRPRTMTTTTTHDTKRGEDVRARLAVLAEMPDVFATWLREWEELAKPHLTVLDDETIAPSPVDRLLFFQTALGAYPLTDEGTGSAFADRLAAYMQKAAREAKQSTSWLAPEDAYEGALASFVHGAMADEELRGSIASKAAAIATYGASNGLAQKILQLASPGICDTYQGSETWDLRLVDPDNRTPVDYFARRKLLASPASPAELIDSFRDGRLKLQLVARALRLRREHPDIFLEGEYTPIEAGDEIVAFVRGSAGKRVVCAVTRLPWHATGNGKAPWALGPVWGDRRVTIPDGNYRNALDDRVVAIPTNGILASELFQSFPVALLVER